MAQDLAQNVLAGNRVAIARAVSMVENEQSGALELLRQLHPSTGNAYRIGITGPPGAGKSTIANKLARHYRSENKRVAIIAVDPTSPFSGGALLGDRVRMTDVELDSGVFIRSMASRGSLGGLSKKAREAADVLDAAGNDVILLETVGVGQSELDIVRAADTTVVVLVPESGDSIQAMKAGLMEIADIFVVNKEDRPGADQAVMSIKMVLSFGRQPEGWSPDVIRTAANEGKGIDLLAGAIASHRKYLEDHHRFLPMREQRAADFVRELVDQQLQVRFWNPSREAALREEIGQILDHTTTPYDLARKLEGM